MFVKQKEKTTLQGNFAKAIKVEKDMSTLKVNQGNNKSINVRNLAKHHGDRKDQNSFDMDGLQRLVKQLSNEIIDLKKNSGEGTYGRGFFRFLDKKNFLPRQQAQVQVLARVLARVQLVVADHRAR